MGLRSGRYLHFRRYVCEVREVARLLIPAVLGIIGTLIGLYFIHRKDRDQEREKRMQYWREQVRCFHRSAVARR